MTARNFIQHSFDQMVPKLFRILPARFHVLKGKNGCLRKADNPRHIFRSGAMASFLPPAVHQGRELDPAAHIHKSDALRPADFVSTCAQEINMHLFHIDRNVAEGLNRIRVKPDAVPSGDLSDRPERLHRTDFIIGRHHRNQNRVRADGCFDILRVYKALRIYRQPGNLKTILFQCPAGI